MNQLSRMERKNPARRLDKRLWFTLVLFAGLIVLHQLLIQPALSLLTSDAPAINLAGRQRMLSQKLAKAALAMVDSEEPLIRESRRKELAATLQTWKTAHDSLRNEELSSHTDRAAETAIQRGFHEVEPHFRAMSDAAEILESGPSDVAARIALDSLLKNEPEFLTKMHSLVGLYEVEARRHVRQLQYLGVTIMIVILGILLAMQLGVLRPELSFVGREWERIEADYQLLVESMTDGLVVFDQQGRVEFANRHFGDMLGESADQLVGKPASIFIGDSDRTQFEKLLTETGDFAGAVDFQLRSTSGRMVDTIISPRRMIDEQGHLQGLLLVVTDITARKANERRSRELQTQLAHADRLNSMGAMAAELAHEINQPLGAITNYAEGCLARLSGTLADPRELNAPLQGILRAAHRGGEIIRRTRDFARNRPHAVNAESVNDLMHEVEELCRPEARRRGVTIESHLAQDLPLVPVDGIQIQQVLTNLIQNALNALERVEQFRRRIKLTTRQSSPEEVELSVADSGPGLSLESAQNCFEPFVTTDENGTGLGLAIARGIVEAHGGRIWNEANRDGGALFRFTLPLIPAMDPLGEYPRPAEDLYVS